MIRKAKPQDIPAIVELAVESVSNNPLPVKISREAMRETIQQCMGPAHFCWVSEIDGVVVGAVVACAQPSFWFERQQASVLMYYSTRRGETAKLLRELARWVKSRPTIKVCVFEAEPESDPRLLAFLRRLGFTRQSSNLCYVRGMTQ
ncbi:MAG: hypothetical protein R3221_06385 [Spongiibacter sp.]|nr:hypothetical protein [Spongiibacter sp.]